MATDDFNHGEAVDPSNTNSDGVPKIDLENPPFSLTDTDRALLATDDKDFHRITWDELHHIIDDNKLEDLKRVPSDLKRYLAWSHDIKKKYGSTTNFVIQQRLKWEPIPGETGDDGSRVGPPKFEHYSEVPFADERDYVVLRNDWPYGLDTSITHLLVWSKTPIAVDDDKGDVTAESRKIIVDFIQRYFVDDFEGGWEKVQWFKNWVSLQSVRGVDHVHVLVRDVDEAVIEKWLTVMDT